MADIVLDTQFAPATPSAGQGNIFIDSTGKILCMKDENGLVHGQTNNASVAAQGPGISSDTWITGSDLLIPSFGFQAKTTFLWMISASKTAASTATPAYSIRVGSARSTADTARLTLTGPAQTAIADGGVLYILATVRTAGAACVIQGTAYWAHRGTAASSTVGTGFANDGTGFIEGTGASFDATAAPGQYVSLSIAGGNLSAWTLTQVQSEAIWG